METTIKTIKPIKHYGNAGYSYNDDNGFFMSDWTDKGGNQKQTRAEYLGTTADRAADVTKILLNADDVIAAIDEVREKYGLGKRHIRKDLAREGYRLNIRARRLESTKECKVIAMYPAQPEQPAVMKIAA